jgi:hypothetical protein
VERQYLDGVDLDLECWWPDLSLQNLELIFTVEFQEGVSVISYFILYGFYFILLLGQNLFRSAVSPFFRYRQTAPAVRRAVNLMENSLTHSNHSGLITFRDDIVTDYR